MSPKCLQGGCPLHPLWPRPRSPGPWLWQGVTGTRGVTPCILCHRAEPVASSNRQAEGRGLGGTPRQVPACHRPGRSLPQPNFSGPSLAPGTSSCRQAPCPQRAGVRRRNKERASREDGGQVLAAEMPSAGSAMCRLQGGGCEIHLPLDAFAPSQAKARSRCFAGAAGVLPHAPTSSAGGEALPGWVFWPGGKGSACLGAVPGAGAVASSARSWGGEAGAGPARRYITFCCEHPQENQPAALNGALCSAFFNLPSPHQLLLAADRLPSPCRSAPSCSLQIAPELLAKPPPPPVMLQRPPEVRGGTVLQNPRRNSYCQLCPRDLQSRNRAAGEFPAARENLCLEEGERRVFFLSYRAAIPLVFAALHKVFTEREEGTANNMFLHL